MKARHVGVVGVGLIGGSVASAARRLGRHVVGYDLDRARAEAARSRGIVDEVGASLEATAERADLVVIALPASAVADAAVRALDAGAETVTDVGSVKAGLVDEIEAQRPGLAARFVGGHPMAGSEQDGLGGADPDLFRGGVWVLTPTATTAPDAFTKVRSFVDALGAEVVAVDPAHHDALVAVVSHVPHLAAGTLMLLAAEEAADDKAALLRLAAGGFRDMTRIASGHPGIWPDICAENRDAIVSTLDQFVAALSSMRDLVVRRDREGLLGRLEAARQARTNLPIARLEEGPFVEFRIPVPDRPGVLAEVTTRAGQLGVNIVDLEIAHSIEGEGGVLVLVVPERDADRLERGLAELGYLLSRRPVEGTVDAEERA